MTLDSSRMHSEHDGPPSYESVGHNMSIVEEKLFGRAQFGFCKLAQQSSSSDIATVYFNSSVDGTRS